ncbi:MAG: hypothetical protein HUK22_08145 [Thermoguttaceae bacterium]|nr:hypothetical protein [Thermoguttaceae bacterium]
MAQKTSYQQAGAYDPRYDLKADVAMVYGVSDEAIAGLEKGRAESGSIVATMTGVAWGGYGEYLNGDFDGVEHWDDAQVRGDGERVLHDPSTPYLVPTVAFSNYLETRLRKIIDAGVDEIYLEEPEFWAFSGFGESFKREWRVFYGEDWTRPDANCDAQYRASKLKRQLYARLLDRLAIALKEYALTTYGRSIKIYIATHSLISYSQIQMVSPESALLEAPGIDGVIAQIWTGTSRAANFYEGRLAERTFETAFLEYGVMQEMTRGTGKRVYFLNDPVEDNPRYDWNDYKRNYLCTLAASLMQPEVSHYEVAPWPSRVFLGSFPAGSPDATTIPRDYASTLSLVFQQLRDMEQAEVSRGGATEGIGVLIADSAMYQRAEPTIRECAVADADDPTRPTAAEISTFGDFFGLALPLIKRGIPINAPVLDNATRYPGYLDKHKILILSYEFQKPANPGLHAILADWVSRGGVLIYVGAETDGYHAARDWWNAESAVKQYATPGAHLMESLGLGENPAEGEYVFGAGRIFVERKRPAFYGRSAANADAYRAIVAKACAAAGLEYTERNYLTMERGPYLIAAGLEESASDAPVEFEGAYVNLFDPELKVQKRLSVKPGERVWALDLTKATVPAPAPLASSCRVEKIEPSPDGGARVETVSPAQIEAISLFKLAREPGEVRVDGVKIEFRWDAETGTVFFKFPSNGRAVVEIL